METNSSIAHVATALLVDYTCVYYVNLETGTYECYSTNPEYRTLKLHTSGDDFFADSYRDVETIVYEEDREMMYAFLSRDNLMQKYRDRDTSTIVYRLLLNGIPVYHTSRILLDSVDAGSRLILGVMNVDKSVRTEMATKTYNAIAQSLAEQYEMIYYVDIETDEYLEFKIADAYRTLNLNPTGQNYFDVSQRNICLLIHPADRERVFEAFDKETMLRNLQENGSFTLIYQLMLGERSSYTRLSVFWAEDHRHIIVAVKNIDREIQRENDMKKMVMEKAIFSQIAESLAKQYDTIYYVDMLTDHFSEFTSTDIYKDLDVSPSGDNFFSESVTSIARVVHPDDRDALQRILTKSTMIQSLQDKHMITHTYRVMMQDGPQFARMSIIWAADNKHVIVGISNVDQEVRREQQVQQQLHAAHEKAYRDELTGVRNKAAYQEMAQQLQARVEQGIAHSFAIVVCDVNGLKAINDQKGHIEGDAYIQAASSLICRIWAHSSVFRVGGDEFVVVLQGEDYENRQYLLRHMREQVLANQESGKVIVATGLSEFNPETDRSVSAVFERADALMYENKSALKGNRA